MTTKIYVDQLDEGWVMQDKTWVEAIETDEEFQKRIGTDMVEMIKDSLNKGVEIGSACDIRVTITVRKSKLG